MSQSHYHKYQCSDCGHVYSHYELRIYFQHLCPECAGSRFDDIRSPQLLPGNDLGLI